MRKVFVAVTALVCCLAFTGAAFAADDFPQVYPKSGYVVKEREKLGGTGEGKVHCEYAFPRDKALADQAVKEIAWLTLPPGASIGVHKHDKNEDAYIVVSGSGVFIGGDGKEIPVKAGDTTIARKGEAHGMKNTGTEPLVILDVIAQQ
ncbi:Cupin domain-containing protein [uncultured delta proteobacterium]|uniref:Cupin domain-containing protein n=1 Tax=uncultured delta proteobacterium TaxID=34034 RepID=A0A212KCV1_9DELT|nr:Cupin domain-containing protein [uncultured delta proteobacterium]